MWRSLDKTTGTPVIRKPQSKDTQRVLAAGNFCGKGHDRGDSSDDTGDSDSSSSNSNGSSNSSGNRHQGLSRLSSTNASAGRSKSSSPGPDGCLSSSRENLAAKSVAFDKRTRVVHSKSPSAEKSPKPLDLGKSVSKQQTSSGEADTGARRFGKGQPGKISSAKDEFSLKRFLKQENVPPRRSAEARVTCSEGLPTAKPTVASPFRWDQNRTRQTKLDEKARLGQFLPQQLQSRYGVSERGVNEGAPPKTKNLKQVFGYESRNEFPVLESRDATPRAPTRRQDSLQHSRATAARTWGNTKVEARRSEGTGWEEGENDSLEDVSENLSHARKSALNAWGNSQAGQSKGGRWDPEKPAGEGHGYDSGEDYLASGFRYDVSHGKGSGWTDERNEAIGSPTGGSSPPLSSAQKTFPEVSSKPFGYWGVGDQGTRIDTFTTPAETKTSSRKLHAMCHEILGGDSSKRPKRSEGKPREGEDSGSLEDSDDEIEHLLSSASSRYVPPHRHRCAQENAFEGEAASEEGRSPRLHQCADYSRHSGESRSFGGWTRGADRVGEGARGVENWDTSGGNRSTAGRSNWRQNERDNIRQNDRDNFRQNDRDNIRQSDRDNFRQNDRDNWRQNDRDNFRQNERDNFRQNDRDNWRQNDRDNIRQSDRDNFRQNDRDNWRQNDRDNFRQNDRDNFRQNDRDNFRQNERDNWQQNERQNRRENRDNGGDRDTEPRQPWRDPPRERLPPGRQAQRDRNDQQGPQPRAHDRPNEGAANQNEADDNRQEPVHRQQQQNRAPPRMPRPLEVNLSFGRLRDMKNKEPAEVVAALAYSREGLHRLVRDEQKLTRDREMMRLLLTVLAKVSQCKSMPTQQNEVLNTLRAPEFFRVLGLFITQNLQGASQAEACNVIADSADLLQRLLTIFPSSLSDVVGTCAFLEVGVKLVKARHIELGEEVERKLSELDMAKEAGFESLQRKQCKARNEPVDEDSLAPPDNFRQISVFPTIEDLEKDELPFLRKNKEKGGYLSLDHYLDVQFRLLREDFVYPLREGIAEYQKMLATPGRGKRLKDIRVYHDVHLLRAVCLQTGLGHRLSFDVSRLKRVKWEISKRLIYGSLICLSPDNFRTLFFATVINREAADLKEGLVDVVFEHNLEEVSAISPETIFTMAETTAFFEAYRHVLAGLQHIGENELPFQRYIVRCEKTIRAPAYLLRNERTVYDLRPLVDDGVVLREDRALEEQGREVTYRFSTESRSAEQVPVLQREEWPDPSLLKLDPSQFEALHRALTKEFSVIQGPPGTGKTYVGLKIVKALLHNRKSWDPDQNRSMLIVCYTNHALDQFLEGVIAFFKGRVVRVGSRLKSEEMKKFTLSNIRWEMRRNRDELDRDFREITRLRFQGHEAMDNLRKEMDTIGLKIEGAKREILHEEVLRQYMLPQHYDRLQDIKHYLLAGFVRQGRTRRKVFCIPEWLGLGAMTQNTTVTSEDLQQLDQELGQDELDVEGEVQALEEQNRLDTEENGDRNENKRKEREKRKALAEERNGYLALDISRLDQAMPKGDDGAFQLQRSQWKKIKRKLRRNVVLDDRMTSEEEQEVADLWELDIHQRWRLYRRWAQNLCDSLQAEIRDLERLYDRLARRQQETLMQEDKHILKNATVIAMTTTAAAKYQSILQEVKPRVVVVEEAAEVLEGHVITTLSQDCQHLILIGDHKQLRPNPTVYALARKYKLELSLFERMINNDLRCDTLGWQHRMRPEIAALVKPIYPKLQNHDSVMSYGDIKGVSSNVYFINHAEPETHDDETKSHSNYYEALYISQLCGYLLKQGYDPSRISILTTYSGQLYQLKKLMPKKQFEGVRLTVVDNFQGEENDIILLSLVRSNEDGNIGFLKIENRVCVALSRAKMGLYVLGNFDLLSCESDLWRNITFSLKKEALLGETLHLYCQNHPEDGGLDVNTPSDFDQAPEGGCMKPCTTRLNCGHVCSRLCHPYDLEHETYVCLKPCERKMECEFQHPCKKRCHQKCGDCTEMVQRVIPKCGHPQFMQCHENVYDFVCQAECSVTLACGHPCGDRCGEPHQCYEQIPYSWPCGHTGTVWCRSRETTPCLDLCQRPLSCGHSCGGKCQECTSGRLHRPCRQTCTRVLVCGHKCTDTCSNCPPCNSKCQNKCVHSECRKLCGLPCTPCREPCVWRCPHFRCTRLCSDPCDRPRCDEPCPKLLSCDHPCIGLCGEPCPKLCRVCHKEDVTEIFFGTEEDPDARFVQLEDCEHIIEVHSLDQWIETTTSAQEDAVQLKACPRCKTPIRRNLRYGAIIKQQLQDIEVIKEKMLGDERKREEVTRDLDDRINREVMEEYEEMKETVKEAGDGSSLSGLLCMQNQMKLLDETKKLRETRRKKSIRCSSLPAALDAFEKWILHPRLIFREQERDDAQAELLRLQHWMSLLNHKSISAGRGIAIPAALADLLNHALQTMKEGLPYTERQQLANKKLLQKLHEIVPESGLGISEEERVMILSAMQLNQGHWYKCRNGHVYAIGDCGGANQVSRCPDCKSEIGGNNHQLVSDNTVATEMDGAVFPAWSEQNNIENFGFNVRF